MPTTHATESDLQGSRTQQFARYIRDAVSSAGYDIDSPRGGGKKALAKATGMSQTSVGRMLAGQSMPDPLVLERLADALHVPLPELLVRSGVISERSHTSVAATLPDIDDLPVLRPEEAARRMGLKDPQNIEFLATTVRMLLEREGS
ncbi:helix-turn-helix domain-containing protein [Streptomyces sp. NPDC004778]